MNKMYYRNQYGDFVPVPFYYDPKSTGISNKPLKEKWITVVDGWRGSLKRDFWVRDDGDDEEDEWKLIEGCELIARDDRNEFKFILIDAVGDEVLYSYLKFKPFSIVNPPPTDWMARVELGIRYFNKVEGTSFCFIKDGLTSKSSSSKHFNLWVNQTNWDKIKWLDIEDIPND